MDEVMETLKRAIWGIWAELCGDSAQEFEQWLNSAVKPDREQLELLLYWLRLVVRDRDH